MVSTSDLKVYKTTNNLGGAITGTQITSATPNNLFTNVPKNELTIGEDYYAAIYFKNTHTTESMDNFKLWLTNKSAPPDTELKWGFESLLTRLQFDGVNDYIDCTNDADLWSQSLTTFSFSFWIFPTAGWDTQTRAVVNHNGSVAQGFRVIISPTITGRVTFRIVSAASIDQSAINDNLTLNEWNHVVCTYDNTLGSANMKIYIDKVVGTSTNFTEAINNSAILTLADSSNDFKGYMRDFRWWTTKALTQTEIDNVYNDSVLAPQPDYWLEINEGTGNPIDSISSTKIGTLSGPIWNTVAQTIADKYTSPLDVTWNTVSGEPSAINFTKLNVNGSFPIWLWLHVNANAVARLDDSALFAFKFGIPSGGTGTPGGGSGGSPSSGYHYEPFGEFDGITDFVEQADAPALNLDGFSMAAWFKTSKDYTIDAIDGTIISKGGVGGDTPGGNQNYGIRVFKDTNKIRAGFESNTYSDGMDFEPASTMTVNDGQWRHVVCTHDTDAHIINLYINGVLNATMDTVGAEPEQNTNPLRLGKNSKDSTRYFQGEIDEVYIWNQPLTASEVLQLFQNGTVPQESAIVYENTFGGSTGTGGGSGGTGGNPPPTPTNYKVAFAGDWGCEPETDDVIDLIQSQGYDYTVGVGDNAYESAGCWTGRFDVLKPNFNSAYGNHEYSETGGTSPYKNFFGHSLTYFTFKFQNIQFFVVDTNLNSDVGSTQHNFISNALAVSQNDSSVVWRIGVMHHPMYGTSSQHPYNEFDQRQNFHSLFQNNGVDFVVVGHNHNWQRTHQIAYNSASNGSPNIIDNTSPYSRSANAFIHVVTGTGGHDSSGSLYSIGSQPSYQAYQDNDHNGVWEIVASNSGNTLTCSFVDVNGDKFDTFTITA